MGELFDICERELKRLRPLFEEKSGVDLSDVVLVNYGHEDLVRDITASLFRTGLNLFVTKRARRWREYGRYMAKLYRDSACWCRGSTIFINEPVMAEQDISAAFSIAHELSHAVQHSKEKLTGQEELRGAIAEGFALYFQMDYLAPGNELEEESRFVREQLLLCAESHNLTDFVEDNFSFHWNKIKGYAFFSAVAEFAGEKDVIWSVLEHPPASMEELENPESYHTRLKAELESDTHAHA